MGIRPGRAIRDSDKVAWTRYSRRKPRKSFIKAMPHANLHQFRNGVAKTDYDATISLVSDGPVIIRDNALESARMSVNKHLEEKMVGAYYFVVRVYPHHVVRENKMIAGAGADRLQKGMRQAFGRPTAKAARLKRGTEVFTIQTYKANTDLVKHILDRVTRKLSGDYSILAS